MLENGVFKTNSAIYIRSLWASVSVRRKCSQNPLVILIGVLKAAPRFPPVKMPADSIVKEIPNSPRKKTHVFIQTGVL